MEIEKKIVDETMCCKKEFDCLKNNTHIYCKVENCINKQVHFVKCSEDTYCAYKMSFGNSFLCVCPTRKEIFNKYGL